MKIINVYGEITLYIYRVGLWFLCTALPLTANIFHGQVPDLWLLKMDKPGFFSDKPETNLFYKISSYQGFTSKQTLILVSLLSFII